MSNDLLVFVLVALAILDVAITSRIPCMEMKIFYSGNNFADLWSGNIDLDTGAVI